MKAQRFLLFLVFLISIVFSRLGVRAEDLTTNYFGAVNREIDLVRSIFVETNTAFDKKLFDSLGERTKEVRFIQVSLLTFYPSASDVGPLHCEMVVPPQLVRESNKLVRLETATNEIPLNYIRVFDPAKSVVTANLELFLCVTEEKRPNVLQYVHRTFRFVRNRDWKAF